MWNYWFPNGVLQSRNPYLQTHGSRNPKVYFWHPISRGRAYFQFRISPRFCFKILNPQLQWRENQDPEKPNGVHQTNYWLLFNIFPQHIWVPTVKEGVNGVNRLATKGGKYNWLPTKRVKNYRLPTGKILTDYRHGLTLSIFVCRKKSILHFFSSR